MMCKRCKTARAIYNVISPVCFDSVSEKVCPACFQDGLDQGEIIWLGDKPFGICADHEQGVA